MSHLAPMPTPKDHRHMTVLALLAAVTCGALLLIAFDVHATSVKDVLAIIFPPIVALAAAGVGEGRRG